MSCESSRHSYLQCSGEGCRDHIPRDFFSKKAWDKFFPPTPVETIEIEEMAFYLALTGQPPEEE